MEHLVATQFIYPALLTMPPSLVFSNQFAFRPTGSTTAAVIAILQTVTDLLSDHPYVTVISLNFSKASNMVRHSMLLQKFTQLDVLDAVYNWLVNYFAGHSLLHYVQLLDFSTVQYLGQHCAGLGNRPGVVCRQRCRP